MTVATLSNSTFVWEVDFKVRKNKLLPKSAPFQNLKIQVESCERDKWILTRQCEMLKISISSLVENKLYSHVVTLKLTKYLL